MGFQCPDQTGFIQCPSNTYQKITGQTSCLIHNADAGTYINTEDEAIACPEGNMCPGGDAQPIICPAGTYN